MKKHTPGPWKLSENRDYAIESVHGDFLIGHYEVTEDNESQDLANARLIAAAPDLLAALDEIFHDYEIRGMPEELNNRALAAIKKAKGDV